MSVERPELFAPGEAFRGYVVEKLLGRGGLGAVYLVRHAMLNSLFALKVLYPDVAKERESYVARFLREARLATRIRHPNLVAVHDCGFDETKGVYFLTMDYVLGGNLRQALAFSGKLSVEEATDVVAQVARALDAAQKFGVVHRDIKPENIMIQPDGLVKLVDLGIAKANDPGDAVKTTTDTVFGTPAYVSPEQALSPSDVDARADVYSLGIVLFEAIAGRVPYADENPARVIAAVMSPEPVPDVRTIRPEVPPAVAELIMRMVEKDRSRRISSAAALLDELSRRGLVAGEQEGFKAEYVPAAESDSALAIPLDRLPKQADRTLSFETDDPEIGEFVAKLKRRRFWRRLLRRLVVVAAAAVVVAIAAEILL